MKGQVIYSEDAVYNFDEEKDKDLFEHYSPISLLMVVLPSAGDVKLECGEQYRVTIERITS